MKQQMLSYGKLCLIILLLTFVSCAHRSGHGKRVADQNRYKVCQNQNEEKVAGDVDSRAIIRNQQKRDSSHRRYHMDGAEIFSKFNEAVFMIVTFDGKKRYQGSGFFIGKDGLAVSNYHVFQNTGVGLETIKLAGDNRTYKVSHIYAKDEKYDFILFRVACKNKSYIPIANIRPQVGDKVFAIGSPRGLENTFSSGEISQWRDQYLIQISALIDHGSSGGALVNEYGEAVGITSGTFAEGSQANLNYAWSVDVIKPYL